MTPVEALARIEAELAAATPGPWELATDKGAPEYVQLYSVAEIDEYEADVLSGQDGTDVLVSEANATLIAHAPTYLAALVEVAKAANNGLFECENLESGEPWYKWLRAALDALTKAVQP